ncbi:beta-ketoacyl synthase N-terminal-like domain-containing protein [Streptomyces sp. CA-135486]|uniref:beta-ketoacyl synthase N-terminal-like domain-containing protein n=1 Tax=Streptomyces sp. CA-135486 TaxID=3240049 RepID=UPI003D9296DC
MTAAVTERAAAGAPVPVAPLAVTGAAAVTPAGIGLGPLGRAVQSGTPGLTADSGAGAGSGTGEEGLPPRPVRTAPELPVAELIGRKGTRNLDRTTTLSLIACRLALDSFGGPAGERAGVVLGTSTGSISSSSGYSLETLRKDPPYLVNPSLFPHTVMNCAAGQIAIRNGLHGVNATLAGGQLSGVQAIRYARNALRQGHADRLLVGGVEEFCPQSAWAWHRSGALDTDAAVGEGAAVLMVEPEAAAAASGRPVLARVLAAQVGFAGGGSLAGALAEVIGAALRRSGTDASAVGAVSLGSTGQRAVERIEERGVGFALDGRVPARTVRVKEVVGECFSASGALQMAALLGVWQAEGVPAGEIALVTAVGQDGAVGCVVLESGAAGATG